MYGNRSIVIAAVLAVVLSVFTVVSIFVNRAGQAQTPPEQSATFEDALWVAQARGLMKIATDDATILFTVAEPQDMRVVTVDAPRQQVWAYSHNTLQAFNFTGEFIRSVSLDAPRTTHTALAVNTNDGTVWLGVRRTLRHFATSGALLHTIPLPEPILALAMDPSTARLWVGTETTVRAYNSTGRRVIALDLGRRPHVQDLDIDASSGDLWVALQTRLRRYNANGNLMANIPLKERPQHLASDGQGGVWIAGNRRLLRMNATGQVVLTIAPPGRGQIAAVVADPNDQSVWVAKTNVLSQITADGEILHDLRIRHQVRDLALFTDHIVPEIAFLVPVEGSTVDTNTPIIEVEYRDSGVGVDTTTLSLQSNAQDLEVNCTFGETSAACNPATALPEGLITLSATIADLAGNVSDPAEVRFTVQTAPGPPVNRPPVLARIGDQVVALGNTLNLTLLATDPDGNPLTFSATPLPLPSNASLNGTTGVFTFEPAADQAGTLSLTFIVSDGILTDAETIQISVQGAPPGGVTALTGRILDTNAFVQNGTELPVKGVRVSLLNTGVIATSDGAGRFALSGIPAGSQVLDIDTTDAEPAPDDSPYAGFREELMLIAGVTNVVERPLFLPRIARESLTTVDPTQTTVVTNPTLQVSLTVPPNTAKAQDGTNFTGQLSISEVVAALAPAALPEDLEPGLLITIQPVGVTFATPAPVTFPNTDNLAPGSETDIWSLDPVTGTFVVVGTGRVSDDGTRIETIEGGIRAADWHMVLPPAANGAPENDEHNEENQDPDTGSCPACGGVAAVSAQSGGLTRASNLPSYRSLGVPRTVELVYNSLLANPRPVLPFDSTIVLRAAVPPTLSYSLEVGGIAQGTEVFVDTSGLDEETDETIRNAVQFDASTFPTGRYPVTLRLKSHYASSRVSSRAQVNMLVNNEQDSPFGAGWTLKGLQRLHVQPDQSILLTEGDGAALLFTRVPPCLPPPAGGVAWWPGDGDANDIQGGNNGILQGRTTFTPGEVDQAFNFDGSTGYIQVPQNSLWEFGSSDFTVDFWINFRTPNTSGTLNSPNVFDIIGVDEGAGRTNKWLVRFGGGVLTLHINNRGSGPGPLFLAQAPFSPDLNRWYFIALTRLGNTFTTYIDGQQAATETRAVAIPPINAPLTWGLVEAGRYLDGLMDEVAIYNRALSAAEVQAIFTAGSGGKCKGQTGTPTGFRSPPGDFSTLATNLDGSFTRTLKDGTKITFNAQGLHTSTADRNGNRTTYAYDGQGRLATITDARGLVTTFSYTGGLLSSVTDPADRVTTFTHDSAGNLTQITYPDSSLESFTYDGHHLLTAATDPRGVVTTFAYDFAGRYLRTLEPDSSTRTLSASQLVGLVDTSGGVGSETNPAPVVRPDKALAQYTDGNLNATALKTDSLGNITRQTDALKRITTIVRDADGLPTRITQPNGAITTMTYDDRGNLLTSSEESIRATATFTYDPTFNHVTSITDPNKNPPTTIDHDANGNPIEIIDAKGTKTTMRYEDPRCLGQLTSMTSAVGLPEENTTSFAYDPATCNLVQTTDPLGNTTALAYDAAGNVIQSTDAEGRVTRFQYDVMNRLAKVIDATNTALDPACGFAGVTCYGYDKKGNLTSVTDARGNTTVFDYDEMDRLKTTIDPLGAPETFAYDGNGNLISTLDRKGQAISFEYDVVNQLIKKTLPGNLVTAFAYDAVGNLNNVMDPDSKLTLGYDLASRLISASTAGSSSQPDISLTYTYDNNGNRLTMTDPKGTTGYAYDSLNRLDTLTDPARQMIDLDYDNLSRRSKTTLPNGSTASFAYDPASQLLNLVNTAAATTLSKYTYSYNKTGNRNQVDQQRSAVVVLPALAYQYDGLNRLARTAQPPLPGTTVESYNYDPVGNRLRRDGQSVDAVFDTANRLLEDQSFTYTYDDNGNRTRKTEKGSGATTLYIYDAENQLTRIDFPDGRFAEYRYDGLGRRIEKNVNGEITRYVYDYEDSLFETDTLGTIRARYTYGPGIDEPLILDRDLDASGSFEGTERFFYHVDGLGSVTELTDSTSAVARAYVYDSFGRITQQVGSLTNPYTYTGREFDAESGLYYYRARYYDAAVGRFLQEDLIGGRITQPATLNLYAYVVNNPVNWIDPSGNIPLDTLWDVGNILYDLYTGNVCDLAADLAALAVPYVPAGSTKLARVARAAKAPSNRGRLGRQARLREIANDPKASSADRGWIRNEQRQIAQGNRDTIRNPPGKDLAHERGREAKKGYSYEHSNLQDRDLHRLQHKHDDFGRANRERPPE